MRLVPVRDDWEPERWTSAESMVHCCTMTNQAKATKPCEWHRILKASDRFAAWAKWRIEVRKQQQVKK